MFLLNNTPNKLKEDQKFDKWPNFVAQSYGARLTQNLEQVNFHNKGLQKHITSKQPAVWLEQMPVFDYAVYYQKTVGIRNCLQIDYFASFMS